MKQQHLSLTLRIIIIVLALIGLVFYLLILPEIGRTMVYNNPEFSHAYYPWLIGLWVSALPCFAVLVFCWLITANIKRDRSFSIENARYMKIISILAGADAVYFFILNITLLMMNMNHPGIVLGSLLVTFIGICICAAAAVLSHLILKAADLQDQSDLTI